MTVSFYVENELGILPCDLKASLSVGLMFARSSKYPVGPIVVSPIKTLFVSQYSHVKIPHKIGPR